MSSNNNNTQLARNVCQSFPNMALLHLSMGSSTAMSSSKYKTPDIPSFILLPKNCRIKEVCSVSEIFISDISLVRISNSLNLQSQLCFCLKTEISRCTQFGQGRMFFYSFSISRYVLLCCCCWGYKTLHSTDVKVGRVVCKF